MLSTYWFRFESVFGNGWFRVRHFIDISNGDADLAFEEIVALEKAKVGLTKKLGRDFVIDENKIVVY